MCVSRAGRGGMFMQKSVHTSACIVYTVGIMQARLSVSTGWNVDFYTLRTDATTSQ
jgi:hypothetical protein